MKIRKNKKKIIITTKVKPIGDATAAELREALIPLFVKRGV